MGAAIRMDRRRVLAWAGTGVALAVWPERLLADPSRYSPYDPHELALFADLVVVGVIRDVRLETFVVDVEERISEREPAARTLEVRKFVDWTCASRWTTYAVGQRSLFYLRRPRPKPGEDPGPTHPRVLGLGNEGECPVTGEPASARRTIHTHLYKVVWVGRESVLTGHEPENLDAYGASIRGVPIQYGDHAAAVRGLRQAFRWHGGYDSGDDARIEQVAADAEVDALAERSWFARLLVQCTRADGRLASGTPDDER